jgi:hypothetical protein
MQYIGLTLTLHGVIDPPKNTDVVCIAEVISGCKIAHEVGMDGP